MCLAGVRITIGVWERPLDSSFFPFAVWLKVVFRPSSHPFLDSTCHGGSAISNNAGRKMPMAFSRRLTRGRFYRRCCAKWIAFEAVRCHSR